MDGELEGWGGFAAWAGVGALFGLSAIAMASIGLLVLPVAVFALAGARRRVRPWPEFAGFLPGAGCVGLFIGLTNLGSTPCPSTGHSASGSSSCGGLDGLPWLVVGLVLTGAGLAVYLSRRR